MSEVSDVRQDELSPREMQVVHLVVDGLSNQAIGVSLGITSRTAQAHVAASMRKLGVTSRTQLAVHALRAGIVPLTAVHGDEPCEESARACER